MVEFGGVTRAATALGMPQSHVSRRIFERTGRGLAFTTFGQYLVPKIQGLVDLSDTLVEEVLSPGCEVIGDVRTGLLPSLVPLLGSRIYSALASEFPLLCVHLTEASSSLLEECLGDGQFDIATLIRDDGMIKPTDIVLKKIPQHLVGKAGEDLPDARWPAADPAQRTPRPARHAGRGGASAGHLDHRRRRGEPLHGADRQPLAHPLDRPLHVAPPQ